MEKTKKSPNFLPGAFGVFAQLVVEATFLSVPERKFKAG